jgi:signal transduction histidine kinase
LGNAIKYSPQNGKITIATAETSRNIEIRIADEGIGIPKK